MRPIFDVGYLLEPPEWPGSTVGADSDPSEVVEVLGLVCAGLSVPQIAEGLGVSTATVMTHITRSLRLGHSGSDELVARARAIFAAEDISPGRR